MKKPILVMCPRVSAHFRLSLAFSSSPPIQWDCQEEAGFLRSGDAVSTHTALKHCFVCEAMCHSKSRQVENWAVKFLFSSLGWLQQLTWGFKTRGQRSRSPPVPDSCARNAHCAVQQATAARFSFSRQIQQIVHFDMCSSRANEPKSCFGKSFFVHLSSPTPTKQNELNRSTFLGIWEIPTGQGGGTNFSFHCTCESNCLVCLAHTHTHTRTYTLEKYPHEMGMIALCPCLKQSGLTRVTRPKRTYCNQRSSELPQFTHSFA